MVSSGGVVLAGAVFSRNARSVFPILVLAVYSLAIPPETIFGSAALEHFKDGVALFLAFAGLTLRALVIGCLPGSDRGSGAGADDLRTDGIYSLGRNPLYLGSLLICGGIFLMHGSLHVVLTGMAVCIVLYGLIVRAEEHALLQRFGEAYRTYSAATPRWIPHRPAHFAAASRAGLHFDAKRALLSDWPLILVTTAVLWLTEYFEYMPAPEALRSQVYLQVMSAVGVSLAVAWLLYQALRSGGAAEAFVGVDAEPLVPATRGILVDRRVRSVDMFENALSFGQQEAILAATLEAARLRPGDRLLDVGCGSGKLVIAAALQRDRQEARNMLGIDATPGMIDLARQRAGRAGVPAEFQVGVAEALPLPDGSVEAVTSSYFFHHLPSDVKRKALTEMWRVLAPGGRLTITDYSRARGLYGMIASLPMRANFYEYVRPQLNGELEDIVEGAGLGRPEIVSVFLGYITVMRLVKPLEAGAADLAS